MHIRGHLTPFSQSLANQGMQQTNQNINQAPLQNYTNFFGGSMNLGMQPYQSSGNIMPNNNIMDYMTDPEPTPDYIEEPDFNPAPIPVPPGPAPVFPDFNNPVFGNFSDIIPGSMNFPSPIVNNPLDYNQDGNIDGLDIVAGISQGADISGIYDIIGVEPQLPDFNQPIFSGLNNIIPGELNLGLQPYNPEVDSFIDENEASQMQDTVSELLGITGPSEFTGGGGQGGQAARRLYFPGTSGGFASVGTGIGGGGTTLDDLLRRMR